MNKTQYTFILSSQSPVPNPQSLTSTSDSEIKSDCYRALVDAFRKTGTTVIIDELERIVAQIDVLASK
ncbi:hypothetical protein GXM_03921 [Nostoc sphaeroides CCNUC1]|uniref:Uncharacterized protein n=1 Tax=Nostoc sphaeroides CCNUC1 TaxID=2653204 RepID=A0A5P8W1A9_9NOSO|nr:hypothetical protein GXM_03921 [Nostoc sphaeroides CCNUC1]